MREIKAHARSAGLFTREFECIANLSLYLATGERYYGAPRGTAMDAVERFVVEENAWRYIVRMAHEPDPGVRAVISKLLLREAAKFAREADRLDALDCWIAKLDGHLGQQKALLDGQDGPGADISECRRTIALLTDIRMTLLSLKATHGRHMEIAADSLSSRLGVAGLELPPADERG